MTPRGRYRIDPVSVGTWIGVVVLVVSAWTAVALIVAGLVAHG